MATELRHIAHSRAKPLLAKVLSFDFSSSPNSALTRNNHQCCWHAKVRCSVHTKFLPWTWSRLLLFEQPVFFVWYGALFLATTLTLASEFLRLNGSVAVDVAVESAKSKNIWLFNKQRNIRVRLAEAHHVTTTAIVNSRHTDSSTLI